MKISTFSIHLLSEKGLDLLNSLQFYFCCQQIVGLSYNNFGTNHKTYKKYLIWRKIFSLTQVEESDSHPNNDFTNLICCRINTDDAALLLRYTQTCIIPESIPSAFNSNYQQPLTLQQVSKAPEWCYENHQASQCKAYIFNHTFHDDDGIRLAQLCTSHPLTVVIYDNTELSQHVTMTILLSKSTQYQCSRWPTNYFICPTQTLSLLIFELQSSSYRVECTETGQRGLPNHINASYHLALMWFGHTMFLFQSVYLI